MPLFLIERNFAEQLEVQRDDMAEIMRLNADVGVHWVLSFLSADKKKTTACTRPSVPRPSAKQRGEPISRRMLSLRWENSVLSNSYRDDHPQELSIVYWQPGGTRWAAGTSLGATIGITTGAVAPRVNVRDAGV
jgi:hypothetical protein